VETAVGVWQEEVWRGVADFQRVRCTSVSRGEPTRWLYDCQSAALNVTNSWVHAGALATFGSVACNVPG